MNEKTHRILFIGLVIGMFLSFALIAHQHVSLKSLQEQLDGQAQAIEKAKIRQIRSLTNGIYRLEILTDRFGDNETIYTIYNFVIDVSIGPIEKKLQFGYGDGDDAPFILYLDNDSDGAIDTKTLTKYARTIPVAGFVSLWLFDPEYSQLAYDTFRSNIDQAEQLSINDLAEYVDSKVVTLWHWINDISDDIGGWLEKTMEFD